MYIYIFIFTCTYCLYNAMYPYSVYIFDFLYIYSILLSKSSLKGASFAKTFCFFSEMVKTCSSSPCLPGKEARIRPNLDSCSFPPFAHAVNRSVNFIF